MVADTCGAEWRRVINPANDDGTPFADDSSDASQRSCRGSLDDVHSAAVGRRRPARPGPLPDESGRCLRLGIARPLDIRCPGWCLYLVLRHRTRKNWEDMLTAFAWGVASEDAVLVLSGGVNLEKRNHEMVGG